MKEQEKLPSLEALAAKIRNAQTKGVSGRSARQANAGLAMRMGLELVSGVLVGAGIGILLDKWLGTSPFLLVICFFLGSAAGFVTLYRTANAMAGDSETDVTKESDEKQ